jgi:hypothetical protein
MKTRKAEATAPSSGPFDEQPKKYFFVSRRRRQSLVQWLLPFRFSSLSSVNIRVIRAAEQFLLVLRFSTRRRQIARYIEDNVLRKESFPPGTDRRQARE